LNLKTSVARMPNLAKAGKLWDWNEEEESPDG